MKSIQSGNGMRRTAWGLALVALLAGGAALAQNVRQMQAIKPIQQTTAAPPVANVMDYQSMHVKEVEKNKKLRAELDAANGRLGEMTRLGGSLVHAYCPADQPYTSRNTAGAASDCGAAGYACEPVSGLCRTSCQTSDMCSSGFVCDTGAQQCVRP